MTRRSPANEPECCELCGRAHTLTFHHLIPRTLHKNKWFKRNYTREQMQQGAYLCRDCHGAVHRFVDEKTLGRQFYTLELLRAQPDVAKFTTWVSARSGRFRTRT